MASTKKNASNKFKTAVNVGAPRSGTIDASLLIRWLNIEHCGSELPPNETSKEHADATWRTFRFHATNLELELQRDGSFLPISIEIDGKKFLCNEIQKK